MADRALNEVLEGIRDAAQDLISLDVVTLTGGIAIASSLDEGSRINLKKLYDTLQKSASTSGALDVVAYTHIDFDKDAINFVKQALGEGDLPLVQAHNEMVKTSQEGRLALVKAVKELVGMAKSA